LVPLSRPAPPGSFDEFLASQPEHIATVFARFELLVDSVEAFCDALGDLSNAIVASDGGAVPYLYGAFGWVVATRDPPRRLAQGKGPVFGFDPRSYRSENYGSWAGNLFIQKAFEFLGRPLPTGSLRLCADNLGMIRKLNWLFSYRLALTKSVLDSEWDILQANFDTLARYPDQPTILHVKGHQDKTKSYEELSFSAKLNVDADRLCNEYMEECGTPFPLVPFDPSSQVMLVVNGHSVTRRLEKTIRTAAQLPALKKYYCERFHWEEEWFQGLDWEAFGSAFAKNKQIRNFLTKLNFRLLPVGE